MDNNVDNGNNQERLFTQDEVNEIIRKRLKKYKASEEKVEDDPDRISVLDQREKDLDRRSFEIECKEYINKQGYNPEFMDFISADNIDDFKSKADGLSKLVSSNRPVAPPMGNPELNAAASQEDAAIKKAFSAEYRHKPKDNY